MYYQALVHGVTQSKRSDAYQFRRGNPNFCYTGLVNMQSILYILTTRNTKCMINNFPAARHLSAQWQLLSSLGCWAGHCRHWATLRANASVVVVRGWDWGSSLIVIIGRLGVGCYRRRKLLHPGGGRCRQKTMCSMPPSRGGLSR